MNKAIEQELLALLEVEAQKHLPGQHDQKKHGRQQGGPEEVSGEWSQRMQNSPLADSQGRHPALSHISDENKAILEEWAKAVGLDKAKIVAEQVAVVENLRKNDPELFEKYRNWYREAEGLIDEEAAKLGIGSEDLAAIVSIMSANQSWEENVAAAASISRWYLSKPTVTLLREEVEKIPFYRKNPDQVTALFGDEGRVQVDLWEVDPDLVCAAEPLVTGDRIATGGVKRPTYWSVPSRKAAQILRGTDPWSVLASSPKQASFAWNLVSPEDPDVVTVDFWMLRAATGDPRLKRGSDPTWIWKRPSDGKVFGEVGADGKVIDGIDGEELAKIYMEGIPGKTGVGRVTNVTNRFGAYAWHQDWVEQVADQTGLTPPEAQAIIWSWARDHEPRFKGRRKLKPDENY